jgi:hypothetical protein
MQPVGFGLSQQLPFVLPSFAYTAGFAVEALLLSQLWQHIWGL